MTHSIARTLALLAGLAAAGSALAQDDLRPAEVPDGLFHPDLPPGYVLIEGDIQVRMDRYLQMINGIDSTFGSVNYWNNGVVPYDFVTAGGGAVSGANQALAIAAMNAISARAGVTFRPAVAGDADRIRFQNSTVNNSPVGRQGGTQIINIVSWGTQIIIVHEVYHSLGFWHEQSRGDRGTFVTINYGNVCQAGSCLCLDGGSNCISCNFNFDIRAGASAYGFYDFDSFMHYGRTAFSCGGDTITVNQPWTAQWQDAIGQRDHFSYLDRITCRGIYPFAGDRWVDWTWPGVEGGTFLLPWNDSVQVAAAFTPAGGTLYLKAPGHYSGVGFYNNAITIEAPAGDVTIGN